jgi:hypothetical protein
MGSDVDAVLRGRDAEGESGGQQSVADVGDVATAQRASARESAADDGRGRILTLGVDVVHVDVARDAECPVAVGRLEFDGADGQRDHGQQHAGNQGSEESEEELPSYLCVLHLIAPHRLFPALPCDSGAPTVRPRRWRRPSSLRRQQGACQPPLLKDNIGAYDTTSTYPVA